MEPASGRLLQSLEESMSAIWPVIKALVTEEEGQDLLEYALLGALVAILTIVGLRLIEGVIGAEYGRLDRDEQDLWIPPNPSGS